MKLAFLALAAGICFAQSTLQLQNGPSTGMPFVANAGSGQPFSGKVVTGSPFTAEVFVEMDQTLADGSHITGRQNLTAARDSQGRTYREETQGTIAGSPALKTIYISDPVAKVNYILGPDHIAHKTPMLSGAGAGTVSTNGASARLSLQTFATGYGGGKGPVQPGPGAQAAPQTAPGAIDSKQLGSQIIAGFNAEGTRSTVTIPAGQFGNQNPLVIVSERWYSQDLGATVLAKHSDPRFGSSTYQLSGIEEVEPPAALFQIPSGYTIEEDGQ